MVLKEIVVKDRTCESIIFDMKFKILFTCTHCKRDVEPDEFRVGRRHVYAVHCGVMQEIGCVS